MWKPGHRLAANRGRFRYPSDLNDAEWTLIAPLISPARRGGRRRSVNVREILNAIFYVLSTGCQWKALPKDPPPKSTAHFYFMLWNWDGTLERIHHVLYVAVREQQGREASPSAAIIDSQSAKAAPKGGASLDPQGYDAGKKVTGRKRHILVDTLGLLPGVSVLPANIQDRDGTRDLLRRVRRHFPFIEKIFADAGYRGAKMATIAATGHWRIEIVKRTDLHRFIVLPKRWIVERTFAWISRNRRLARDFERYATTVAAFVRRAMIRLMLKRLAKPSPCS
jgi:transposase